MKKNKTSISDYYKNNKELKEKYMKLLNKFINLKMLLMSLNHKINKHFDDESDNERF